MCAFSASQSIILLSIECDSDYITYNFPWRLLFIYLHIDGFVLIRTAFRPLPRNDSLIVGAHITVQGYAVHRQENYHILSRIRFGRVVHHLHHRDIGSGEIRLVVCVFYR